MTVVIKPAHPVAAASAHSSARVRGLGVGVDDAMTCGVCPLADAPERCDLRCTGLDVPTRTRQRMAELGLRLGASVRVQSRTSGRGFVLSVAGARVAIDAATAAGILVRSVPTTGSGQLASASA